MSEPPFLLIVNPKARAGKAKKKVPLVQEALREAGAKFDTMLTRGPGDGTIITREALRNGCAGIVVVGGDGTLHECVNGFFDEKGEPVRSSSWLSVLPCGTGGDFPRTLGMSRDPVKMVKQFMKAKPRWIDVGMVRCQAQNGKIKQHVFINNAYCGFASVVDYYANHGPKWLGGKVTYISGFLRALVTYKKKKLRITHAEEDSTEENVFAYVVSNGKYFGTGLQIAPQADLEDGLLDCVGVGDKSAWEHIKTFPKLYGDGILNEQGVFFRQSKSVKIEPSGKSENELFLFADGESLGVLPAEIWVKEKAILLKG